MGDLVRLPIVPRAIDLETDAQLVASWSLLQKRIWEHHEQRTEHSEWKLRRAMQMYLAVVRK